MLDTISGWYYDIKNGIRNLWRWTPVIWHDIDWDYDSLLTLLEHKLRWMSISTRDHGYHVGSDRNARMQLVCAELCKRIREDNYHDNLTGGLEYKHWSTPVELDGHSLRELHIESYKDGKRVSDYDSRRWHQMADRNRANDLKYLGKMLGKHMLRWWE